VCLKGSGLLEPCAMKVARTVLRGVGGSDVALLPDEETEIVDELETILDDLREQIEEPEEDQN
jgi:hypothetical protein